MPLSTYFNQESDTDDELAPDTQRDEVGPSRSEQLAIEEPPTRPSFAPLPPSLYAKAPFIYIISYHVALDRLLTEQARYHLAIMGEIYRMYTIIQEDDEHILRMDAEGQEDRARFGRIEHDMHELLRMF